MLHPCIHIHYGESDTEFPVPVLSPQSQHLFLHCCAAGIGAGAATTVATTMTTVTIVAKVNRIGEIRKVEVEVVDLRYLDR